MTTRAEIVDKLARRRVQTHYLPNLNRAAVRTAAQQLTNEEWDTIIQGIRDRKFEAVGGTLNRRVLLYLNALAEVDVENALGPDDTLTINEIKALL